MMTTEDAVAAGTVLRGSFNHHLVVLSVVIAMLAS